METLIWVLDSPFSRCIKWLLLKHQVPHQDRLLSWQSVADDALLQRHNVKKQVPTLVNAQHARCDSLLIALDYVAANWQHSNDARLYRLADADVEAAIVFLFRGNMLAEKFGQSPQSELMLNAGIEQYRFCVDTLLDHLLTPETTCGVGAVLLASTLLAALSMAPATLANYRQQQLQQFFDLVEHDSHYRQMQVMYQHAADCQVPFTLPGQQPSQHGYSH